MAPFSGSFDEKGDDEWRDKLSAAAGFGFQFKAWSLGVVDATQRTNSKIQYATAVASNKLPL